ncbi:MAG: hypothetical protein IJU52_04570 [Clostridia bacterium]|nr:hypothetical protein [Clostridia bacterium]
MEDNVRCRRVWMEVALLPIAAVLIVISSELLDLLIGIIVLSSFICTALFFILSIIVIRKQIRYTLSYSAHENEIVIGKKTIHFEEITEIRFSRGVFFDPECNELRILKGEKILFRCYSVRNETEKPNTDFLRFLNTFLENCPQLRKGVPEIGKEEIDVYRLIPEEALTAPAAAEGKDTVVTAPAKEPEEAAASGESPEKDGAAVREEKSDDIQ